MYPNFALRFLSKYKKRKTILLHRILRDFVRPKIHTSILLRKKILNLTKSIQTIFVQQKYKIVFSITKIQNIFQCNQIVNFSNNIYYNKRFPLLISVQYIYCLFS